MNGQETLDAALPLDVEEGDKDLIPEDASDVEPSKDINDDLTQEQKEELSAQREELAAKVCVCVCVCVYVCVCGALNIT